MLFRTAFLSVLLGGGCAASIGDDADELAAQASGGSRYSLWIHGYSPLGTPVGEYDTFTGYKLASGSARSGVNPRAVNWGGTQSIASSNRYVRNALDCFCTGDNSCYVAVHSAGDLQIGYALANYGRSERSIKDAAGGNDASGACRDRAGGGTQIGWNIHWVVVAGGAGGGSELWAPAALLHPVGNDLKPERARDPAFYDHNDTGGRMFHRLVGALGGIPGLPGEDDGMVAYHSAGGVSQKGAFCNKTGLFCDGVLSLGGAATSNGVRKWSYQTVAFRDDGGDHHHGSLVGLARQYMSQSAQ